MVTKHSVDLTRLNEPCFALAYAGHNYSTECKILSVKHKNCGTYKCPFYKPQMCKSWVRIEDATGINLIPPEDAY